jgi:glycosyltransferase involved in cell wall biosynthesis
MGSVAGRPDPRGPIWAIAMVRDEADIIEETVTNLIDQGIDRVLVADHLSTDRTPEILRRLAETHPIDVVADRIEPYWQVDKMNHLARVATALGASWIVPFDADEIWRSAGPGTVADVLHASTAAIVTAEWFTYFPLASRSGSSIVDRFPYRLSRPEPLHKVAFRANGLARLTPGNHTVTLPDALVDTGLRIAHFRFRSAHQLAAKARDGAREARRTGLDDLDYWLDVEDSGPGEREHLVEARCAGADLTFDPVSAWSA